MMRCERPACPAWLNERWERWGEEYATKLKENPKYPFSWKQFDGQRVNHRLLPLLRSMTSGHCSYCDWFPTDVGTDPTIDHFRPKISFPKEAYHWPNLYLCCRTCQEKNDAKFNDQLLRPDKSDYSFEHYFLYNYRDGTLEPNTQASTLDQERAAATIRHFKLNEGGRPAARKRAIAQFRDWASDGRRAHLQDMPFRYILVHEAVA